MCLIGSASYNNGQLSDPKYGHQLIGNAHIFATVLKELRVPPKKPLPSFNHHSALVHVHESPHRQSIMNLRRAIAARIERATGFGRERRIRFPWAADNSPVYYIVRRCLGWGEAGFFSNYLYALTHIAFAKDHGWIPVVDMQNYRTLYSENHPVNGSSNDWNHYFLQPIDTHTAYASGRFILSDGWNRKSDYHPIRETDDLLELIPDRAAKLRVATADYTRIRPEILTEFETWERDNLSGKRVLGVHWRGTDKIIPPPGHRPTPPLAMLLDAIRATSDRLHPDLIFLASDETGIRERLEEELSIPVIAANAFRLAAGDRRGLHLAPVRRARLNHRYLLGLEVLRDAWLLSRCDGLVHGHSNVINATLLFRDHPFTNRILVKSSLLAK